MNLSIAAKFGIFALTAVAVLAACDNGGTTPVDTTAPQFSSSTPANDTTAIAANVAVKIVFNEAMNKTATQAAITFSPAVTPASFVWGNGDKEVTINPPAAGWGTAASYTVTIGAGAKDVAGNGLSAAPKTFKFKATPVIPPTGAQPTADVAANINGFYKPDASALVGPTNIPGLRVGYTVGATGAPDGVAKAFFSFNLPASLTVAKIKSAKLTLVNTPRTGVDAEGANGDGTNVFGQGNIRVESIVYAAATLGAADFTSAGTAPVNIAALSGLTNIDVTTAVKADVTALRAKSQFRASLVEPTPRPATGAWLRLGSTTAPAANQPTLVIEYNP